MYYYHLDHLGTPQVMTDEDGEVVWKADYRPFGEADVTVNTVENNFRFPGQYYDQETGLHYNYFRDYHPGIGRYIEPDPLSLPQIQIVRHSSLFSSVTCSINTD
ncbi:MAG: RHS domain-containing protein [Deltaproteobacteria bacterium]|nr:RHS domain-containing protein [Deltaproteobacteria bacterium]